MHEIRFLADDMVRRLARWLRTLGYDTYYASRLSDDALAEIAEREDRVVLTRHAALAAKYPNLKIHVLQDENPYVQLLDVVRRFCLDLESGLFTRCPVCNALLEPIDKETHADEIPERSYVAFDDFWRCAECGRIYWEGSHVAKIRNQLRELSALREKYQFQ